MLFSCDSNVRDDVFLVVTSCIYKSVCVDASFLFLLPSSLGCCSEAAEESMSEEPFLKGKIVLEGDL